MTEIVIPIQLMFATDNFWVGAVREQPLQDVSHSFFYLVLDFSQARKFNGRAHRT